MLGMSVGMEPQAVRSISVENVVPISGKKHPALFSSNAERPPDARFRKELGDVEGRIICKRIDRIFDVHENGNVVHDTSKSSGVLRSGASGFAVLKRASPSSR